MRYILLLVASFLLLVSCAEDEGCAEGQVACGESCIDLPASDAQGLVEGVLASSCGFGACHGGYYPEEDLDLTSVDALRALVGRASLQDPSRILVVAGDPSASYLVDKMRDREITATDSLGNDATTMPPEQPLCEVKIAAVEAWIEAGAQ